MLQRIGKNDYSLNIKGKPRTFHVNMLKKYIKREENTMAEEPDISSSILELVTCAVIEDGIEEDQLEDLYAPLSEESYKDIKYSQVDRRTEEASRRFGL